MNNLVLIRFILVVFLYFAKSDHSPRWDLMHQSDYVIDTHHVEMPWYNKSYFRIDNFEMVKFNRSFRRVFSASGYIKKEIGINIRGNIQFYKLFSNSYKHFPLTATLLLCQEYQKNTFRVKEILANSSTLNPCPQKPGPFCVSHLKGDHSTYPPLIPSGQYKVSSTFYYNEDKLMSTDVYGSVVYKTKVTET